MRKLSPSIFLFLSLLAALLNACSTEKNSSVNRIYHQTTTRFNGLYNSNELKTVTMRNYEKVHQDDYDEILPVEVLPQGEDQVAMMPIMDTIVVKCTTLIAKHSMPSFTGAVKKKEYNKYMQQTWMMVGIARYYKGDYEGAQEAFKFVDRLFENTSTKYMAKIWLAKTAFRMNDLVKADAIIREVERDAKSVQDAKEEEKKESKKKSKKKKKKKRKKKSKKEEPQAEVPDEFVYELNKLKAEMAVTRGKLEDAEKYMKIVVEECDNKYEAARMHFILAQISSRNGNATVAYDNYSATLKKRSPFVLQFTARLHRAVNSSGSDKQKLIDELYKMASEAKNIEYRDQIYFALGNIAENDNNDTKAMDLYGKSTFYSVSNNKQKAKSYERMGEIRISERNYLKAQKYFDSCVRVAPNDYKNRELIERKANKLKDLVDAIETAALQDSLIRISKMNPSDQEAFLENVKKKLEKEEEERKKQDAIREAELAALQQAVQNTTQAGGGSNRWYFYNERNKNDGFEDFKRIWGQVELEDDWRRSSKMPSVASFNNATEIIDSLPDSLSITNVEEVDKFSLEELKKGIPQNEEQVAIALQILVEALYRSGRIYNEELNETTLAIEQFEKVLTYEAEDKHTLLSAFELYRLYDGVNPNQRQFYANYILEKHPDSDYAKFIEDPNYFVKKRERMLLDLDEYEKQIARFRTGYYSTVRSKTRSILRDEPNNAYTSGYMLLNALSEAALMENKKLAIPLFENIIASFPGSKEAVRSQTMIDIINNGYSKSISANFENRSSAFDYGSGKMYFVIIANPGEKIAEIKKDISNFNREFFSSDRLSTKSSIISESTDLVMVTTFDDENDAKKYLNAFQKARRTVKHLQSHTFFIITEENFVTLLSGGDLNGYLTFYKDFY